MLEQPNPFDLADDEFAFLEGMRSFLTSFENTLTPEDRKSSPLPDLEIYMSDDKIYNLGFNKWMSDGKPIQEVLDFGSFPSIPNDVKRALNAFANGVGNAMTICFLLKRKGLFLNDNELISSFEDNNNEDLNNLAEIMQRHVNNYFSTSEKVEPQLRDTLLSKSAGFFN